MRIWDLKAKNLCREHLLGEHRELHAIYSIILNNKKGYSRHPETLRWIGKLPALKIRHEVIVVEMERRGYKHNSALKDTIGEFVQNKFINTIKEQKQIIKDKHCDCRFE
jgi:hypothetical protein